MKKTILLLISVFILISTTVFAQQEVNTINKKRHKIGFMTGYGNQQWLGVSYDYRVSFFQLQHYYTLLEKETWTLELISQPQFNTVVFRPIDDIAIEEKGFEFGLNAGFLIRRKIVKDFVHVYSFLSSGPHYVSGTPERQVSGFIFSDNLLIGFDAKISGKIYFDLRGGIRHISNASLKKPNWGVNNLVINGGFYFKL